MKESVKILRRDKRLRRLIEEHGIPDLKRRKDPFRSLVRAIIYQQLSGKAAATILDRFLKLFSGKKFPGPEKVGSISVRKLRSAGVSMQKASYIKDLAKKFSDGTIQPRSFGRMTNEEIIEHLTRVKGIGVWSVHMFLIFTLNRRDVLPTGDLGIRKGFQITYKLKDLPDHATMEQLARPWREHASVASWYLWRAADKFKAKNKR